MPGVNPNPGLRPGGLTLLDIVVFVGGGYIPDAGEFNQRVWSALLGVTEGTFRDWIDKYRVPNRRPGNDVYVDAADLRSHLPRRYWDVPDGQSSERSRLGPQGDEGPPQGKVARRRRRRED